MDDKTMHNTAEKEGVKFPQEWTVFTRNFEVSWKYAMDMGIEREHPLFTVRLHSSVAFLGRPALVLHLGPNKDGPRLGMVKAASLNPTRANDFDMFLPPVGASMLDKDDNKNEKIEVRAHMLEPFPVHRFSVTVGPGIVENFEWHHTTGKEVGDLVGGTAAGWTLAKVDGSGQIDNSHGVVAVWAEGYKNKNEALKFRFLGSGASGAFGTMFEYAAVVSALGMWDRAKRIKLENPDHVGPKIEL